MSEPDDRVEGEGGGRGGDIIERVAIPLRAPEHVNSTFDARLISGARAAVARGEVPWRRPHVIPPRRRSAAGWLMRPQRLRVSPLVGLAAAAAFATIITGATLAVTWHGRPAPGVAVASASRDVVRFVIAVPGARSVALVGDFNGWNPVSTPLASDAAGRVWTVSLPLSAGTYQYAFVVDGRVWMADPTAAVKLEDEFGAPSSVLTVAEKRT